MGQCLFKTSHQCGTQDALQVFEEEDGSVTGYCYACSTFVPNPLGEHTVESFPAKKKLGKSKEELAQEILDIKTYPDAEDLPERRLRGSMMAEYGIKFGFDQATGSVPEIAYFPYYDNGELVRWKARLLQEKKMWSISLSTEVDLFGWQEAVATGAKRLIITEGEFDAVALKRIIDMHTKDQFAEYKPAVCSLPNGAGNARRDLSRLSKKIRKHFKDIVFCFDQDEAGNKAVRECMSVFPSAQSITLPAKDANACITENKAKAAFKSITFNAEQAKNTRLIWGETLFESAKKPAEWGTPWPFKGLTDATRGVRPGETWYLGAPQKTGKSVMVDTLIAWYIEQGDKVFAAKPEESNEKTIKMVAGKVAKKIFNDPKIEFDEEAFDDACEKLKGNLALVNVYQNLRWEVLKEDIVEAAASGCKYVFIDPLTVLTNHLNAADANTELQKIAQEAATLAMDLQIVIFITCHVRNPESGTSLERGGKVLPGMFAGSRAMARSCNGMLALEGNRDPSLPEEEKNMRKLVLLENRETGETGEWSLWYNPKTGCFSEIG